jgi:hypothetical protein
LGAELHYAVGRAFAVLTRPLCLFVANNYSSSNTAEGVAIAFLASALALAGTAADPHRRFYIQHFSRDAKVNGLTFYLYAASVLLLASLGSIIVFAIGLGFAHSLALATASVLYFVSEKLADELLRLRLFERDYARWGRTSTARSVLQLAGLAVLLGLFHETIAAWLLVMMLSLANLAVFAPQIPVKLEQIARLVSIKRLGWLARRASRSVIRNRLLWAIALLSSGVGYLDRAVALVLDKATLPLFMLVVMCFSIVALSLDFYYVSRHRRDFLEQTISIRTALASRDFVMSLGIGLGVAVCACVIVLHFSRNGAAFPRGYIVAIALLQTATALAAVPQQILYWKHAINRILAMELIFWALFVVATVGAWRLDLSTVEILFLVVACALFRLALYLVATSRASLAALKAGEESKTS